ncbi:juvenile hormone acid O-methyltransferase-like isoform X1 [Pogonomyrmex barbatus]|uniref:Juvenile hormone acid O-methyltransferase-like isoform X1 n=1 Tax=Pogonomyrmex barbatus TaxID=144034 RepID=A0A6I9W0I3_9HYME|nr:juvenile hormone acid O-methyltransferase-like isoform X1 [Pogonomyrmex barbatus]
MNNDQRCAMEMPEEYAKTNLLSRRDGQDIIEEFSSELSKVQGKCLDIGSGPGNITKDFLFPVLPHDIELVGADISQVMVNYARKNNSNERLSYIILDIEGKMPSEQIGQYDCVTSFYCLHWIYDLSRAFENIFKLLRPNGKALVTFFGFHGMFEAFIRLSQNPRYEFYLQDVHRYVPYFQREKSKNMRASLRKMLEDIGFEILHCSKREKSFQYNSQQNLKIQILPVNPF